MKTNMKTVNMNKKDNSATGEFPVVATAMSESIAKHFVFRLADLDNKVLYEYPDKEELLLMITAAHKYCIQKPMPAPLHAQTFYKHTRLCVDGLKDLLNQYKQNNTLDKFQDLVILICKGGHAVLTIPCLFHYNVPISIQCTRQTLLLAEAGAKQRETII